MVAGILSLQGDYIIHSRVLERLGRKYMYVKTPNELKQVDSLIIPGGESTAIKKLAKENGLWELLKHFNGPILGTCAGIILLASKIENSSEENLGRLDITISRNAYGSQINSFSDKGKLLPGGEELEMVFIRAPRITDIRADVEVIAEYNGEPVGIRQENVMGFTFHPELSDDLFLFREFFKCGSVIKAGVT
jgi:5'-phosphate synthase pdxT subunit